MNARLLFILLLLTIGALWYIIGYWRRKAGEAAFAAARLTEKSEERERYCRLALDQVVPFREVPCSSRIEFRVIGNKVNG